MKSKVVLITGASGEIGKALALAFSKNNYSLVLQYNKGKESINNLLREINKDYKKAVAIKCDITKDEEIKNMLNIAYDYFGGIDILINNAGVSGVNLLIDTTKEEMDNILDINIKGTILVTKSVLPKMTDNKYGKIINISSIWGISGGSMEVIYSTTKAAIIGFTKALAKELGPCNINVNAIAPGFIDTKMNSHLSKEEIEMFTQDTPLSRTGTGMDIASLALFLASDDSSFITGEVIKIDGGYL